MLHAPEFIPYIEEASHDLRSQLRATIMHHGIVGIGSFREGARSTSMVIRDTARDPISSARKALIDAMVADERKRRCAAHD